MGDVFHPVLILSGRYDRICSVEASEFMATNISNVKLVVFEQSGHMTFVEENERYVNTVDAFFSQQKGDRTRENQRTR